MMKIMVIGLGSMGKRRIRLLHQIGKDIEIIGIDSNEERCKEAQDKFKIETEKDIDDVCDAKCAFVCTSPLSHGQIINTCLNKGIHVFTELNLVSDLYQKNIALAKRKGCVLFLSSTFLYRAEINYITESVKKTKKKTNYTYHIGQYLPDWHPWESYKNFFAADKRTNGCREIMAIEFPWLTHVFGKIVSFRVLADKLTGLDIDYPDCFMLQVVHESGTKGMLTVDIASRKAVRNLEVFGEELYLSWDGSPAGLYEYDYEKKENINVSIYASIDRQEGYSSFVIENAYKEEIESFLAAVNKGKMPSYGFEQDKEILALIDAIEGDVYKNEI